MRVVSLIVSFSSENDTGLNSRWGKRQCTSIIVLLGEEKSLSKHCFFNLEGTRRHNNTLKVQDLSPQNVQNMHFEVTALLQNIWVLGYVGGGVKH